MPWFEYLYIHIEGGCFNSQSPNISEPVRDRIISGGIFFYFTVIYKSMNILEVVLIFQQPGSHVV